MKLYQYAILYVPKKSDKKNSEKSRVLVPITELLAEDDTQAQILASRAIPEDYLDKLSDVVLAVRPF